MKNLMILKVRSVQETYLTGLIDVFIAQYDENVKSVPEDLKYEIEVLPKSAKITFSWVVGVDEIVSQDETNFVEFGWKLKEDHFTILLGERIVKLESYVNDVLDKVTA